ncbi:hypothetical protein [Phytohalomonas tamaricis]|uniref:hypothetical protein n=1 Tax=Phytohalomonas tamaricis TaxID=2081032 RepID=UPI000D0BD864|nr:hypothetical protein [Phytohalomonas tamaricis]
MKRLAQYYDHLTPCQGWVKTWSTQFLAQPQQAWNLFESAHRTAFIIMHATRPQASEELIIETLIQAQTAN